MLPGTLRAAKLEEELQAQLQDTRVVRTAGPEEVVVGEATGIPGREIRSSETACAGIDTVPLGVIKDIEAFGAEFEGLALRNGEMLEQAHVELGSPWIIQNVSLRRAESEALRSNKSRRVIEQRPDHASDVLLGHRVRIAN